MESNRPQVSVIIPLYNKAPYIKRALDSVLAQTVYDFEVVVVGGKSTDGGEEIVKGYTDSRIRFIQEAGKGVSAARNQGVDAARAEFIAFLDADDEWLPEYLKTVLRMKDKYPDAGIYSVRRYNHYLTPIDHITETKYWGCPDGWEGIVPSAFKSAALSGTWFGFISAICIYKKIILDVGGFNETCKFAEDLDLWVRISLFHPNVHCAKPLIIYHRDDDLWSATSLNNLSIRPVSKEPFEHLIECLNADSKLSNFNDWYGLNLFINSRKITVAINNILIGNKSIAREQLKTINNSSLTINVRKVCIYIGSYMPNRLIFIVKKINTIIPLLP